MGFFEVIMNLPKIFSNIKFCKQDIENFNPDVLIFIDYSGFNLRIAKRISKTNKKAKIVICFNTFAHAPNMRNIIKGIEDNKVIFIDNLNASIHVRALLTDLFVIDEALRKLV